MRSESYKISECCHSDCWLLDTYDDQPCWGQVVVSAEEYSEDDSWWIHECEGHYEVYDGVEQYKKEL